MPQPESFTKSVSYQSKYLQYRSQSASGKSVRRQRRVFYPNSLRHEYLRREFFTGNRLHPLPRANNGVILQHHPAFCLPGCNQTRVQSKL